MPSFRYEARDEQGRPQSAKVEAKDGGAVADLLRAKSWLVLSVREVDGRATRRSRPRWWQRRRLRSLPVEVSLRQLATLLRAGTTLRDGLSLLAKRAENRRTRRAFAVVAEMVAEGCSLARAMAYTEVFDPIVVRLMAVGEKSGSLDAVARRAADMLESRRELRSSLLTSLSYPAIVVFASAGVTIYMMTGVVPKIAAVLKTFGRRIPTMTQMLIDFSDLVSRHLLNGCLALMGGTILLAVLATVPQTRVQLDRLALRVPFIGKMLRQSGAAVLSETLSLLLRSGVTVLDSLHAMRDVPRNRFLARRLVLAHDHVRRGGALADMLEPASVHGPLMAPMVAVGERCGSLDEVLEEAARLERGQLRGSVARFAAVVEPVLIVAVGGIVGFVYIAFFMAIFSFSGGIG